jgi:hypothetical protein
MDVPRTRACTGDSSIYKATNRQLNLQSHEAHTPLTWRPGWLWLADNNSVAMTNGTTVRIGRRECPHLLFHLLDAGGPVILHWLDWHR